MSHLVSAATTHLCHCIMEADDIRMNEYGCAPVQHWLIDTERVTL